MAIVIKDDIIQIEQMVLGPWDTNAYIVKCLATMKSVLVDAPAETANIIKSLQDTHPEYLLLTHNHDDHIGALAELRNNLQIPLGAHAADSDRLSAPADISLKNGDLLEFGQAKLEVLHTPGHTLGSLCFKHGKFLFSGDTLFPRGPGRTKTPADFNQIVKSITDKIMVLPDETEIYPGHGEPTTLKRERDEFIPFSSQPYDLGLCGDVLWLSP